MRVHFLLLAAMMLLGAEACAGVVRVALHPHAVVTGPQVLLGEVAALDGAAADVASLSRLPVAASPRAGIVRHLRVEEVDAALRRVRKESGVQLGGAAETSVTAAVRTIEGSELADQALAALRQLPEAAGMSLEPGGPVASLEVPAREFSLRARQIDAATLAPRMTVWVDVLVDGRVYRSAQVPVAVTDERTVLVALADMAAGDELVAARFETVRRNVAGARAAPLAAGKLQAGLRLARRLRAGEVLGQDCLALADAVMAGDRVRVLSRESGLLIEMVGTVVHGGVPGQAVDVRVAHSGQALKGVLAAGATVVLR
jgi:flagella basal body P-ring formation protein FlgA